METFLDVENERIQYSNDWNYIPLGFTVKEVEDMSLEELTSVIKSLVNHVLLNKVDYIYNEMK